jgi:hypothetical protein
MRHLQEPVVDALKPGIINQLDDVTPDTGSVPGAVHGFIFVVIFPVVPYHMSGPVIRTHSQTRIRP